MNRNRLIILILGLLLILTGIWAYPKIDQFFKVDICLDKGGRWNYETKGCEFESNVKHAVSEKADSIKGYNQLADEQSRSTYTISKYNADVENKNIDRLERTIITNPTIDTTQLFKIWTTDPYGPHADFWLTAKSFYVVDYNGDGAMPYILDKNEITIFYNDFVQKGKIVSVSKDTLKIHWNDMESPTQYLEWEN